MHDDLGAQDLHLYGLGVPIDECHSCKAGNMWFVVRRLGAADLEVMHSGAFLWDEVQSVHSYRLERKVQEVRVG